MKDKTALLEFVKENILFSREAADYLGISMQRLNQLVHTGQLKPVKQSAAGSLFFIDDLVIRRKYVENKASDLDLKKELVQMTDVNNDVLNYYTIQSFFNSDKKATVAMSEIREKIDVDLEFSAILKDLAAYLAVSTEALNKAHKHVADSFAKLNKSDIIIRRGSQLYPKLLDITNEAPPYLFMRGRPELLNEKIVSIVGTRNPSESGKTKAYTLSTLLGHFSIVVASGLARGIDTEAHKGALKHNSLTIAVIGTPLTKVYPNENAKLQQEISEQGLVLSQFAPSSPVERWHFPMRNAVMSGISLATVIIEAGETSGALIQADYALKQGRLVFIPQSALDNDSIKWPKKYIARNGARKFARIDELLYDLERNKIIVDKNEQLNLLIEGASILNVPRSE